MSFESILTYVGPFGRFQIFIFCIVGFHGLIGACVNVGIVFIAPDVDHWCSVPALDHRNLTVEKYRQIVAPPNHKCKRYDLNYSQVS
jgi:hypothetical protein